MKRPDAPAARTAEPAPAPPPPGLRTFLYLTAGLTGAAVMIVEILGAKMLAPYVGTSHFVWTAQIAVTMVALAVGYYLGGRLVGTTPRLGRLYGAIVLAAAFLALSVAIKEPVVYAVLSLPLAAGSLLASVFLFFVPLCLLAVTGPFVVRVITSAVSEVGGNMGRLTAVSTIGSFVGTVAIGYVLIPLLPNSVTMYGTAVLLVVVSLVYFLGWARKASSLAAVVVIAAAGLAAGGPGIGGSRLSTAEAEEVFRANSNFGLLQVAQLHARPYRLFMTDYLIQNTYDASQGRSISMFTYMLEGLARAYAPRLDRVLCIGMGMGIVPRELARSGVSVDVVEINPAIVPVARRFFDLDPSAFHSLVFGDGRYYLNRTTQKYDAVILDAFVGDSSPSHLMSREAFQAVRRVLTPDGVLVMNTFADVTPPRDFMAASLLRTLSDVFASVKAHGVVGGNTLFVASPRATLEMLNPPSFTDVHPDALSEVREAFAGTLSISGSHGILLTDDYNPVEYYDAANREKYRRSLALSMRSR